MVWLRDDYRFFCIEKSIDDPELAKQVILNFLHAYFTLSKNKQDY